MILVSNLKIKLTTFVLLLCYPLAVIADPEINGELTPPGEAMYVTDPEILSKLNLGPDSEPVWCYSNLANSLIITSADREREKCKLKVSQELRLQGAQLQFQIDSLQIEIDSLTKKHNELLHVKDQQIQDLTAAALKRPNDYTAWWVAGSFVTGVGLTLLAMFSIK